MRIRLVVAVAFAFCGLAAAPAGAQDRATAPQASKIEGAASLAPHPFATLFAGGNYWVTSSDSDAIGTITAVKSEDGTVAAGPFPTGGRNPSGLAFDGSSIWVGHRDDVMGQAVVSKLDTLTGTLLQTVGGFEHVTGLAFDKATGSIWVNDQGANTVTKLRASDGEVLLTVTDGLAGPMGNFFDGTNLWIANFGTNSVTKIDTDGNILGQFVTGSSPAFIDADADGNIWVTNTKDDTVTKLSADGTVLGNFPAGSSPLGIKFDGTDMWIANPGAGAITQLNPSDGSIKGTFRATRDPRFIAADRSGKLLVTSPPAVALTAAEAGLPDPCVGGTFDLQGETARCTFSPGYYEFVIPWGVNQEYVQVFGAQGGSSTVDPFGRPEVAGGAGGYVGGMTAVTPGYAMLVTVGGQGVSGGNGYTSNCGKDFKGTPINCGGVGGGGGYNGGAQGANGGNANCCPGIGGSRGGFGGGAAAEHPLLSSMPAARVVSLLGAAVEREAVKVTPTTPSAGPEDVVAAQAATPPTIVPTARAAVRRPAATSGE